MRSRMGRVCHSPQPCCNFTSTERVEELPALLCALTLLLAGFSVFQEEPVIH